MKLFSFLVLIFAFLGNSKASVLVNTVHVLNNLEVAGNVESAVSEVTELKILSGKQEANVDLKSPKIDNEYYACHCNFTINRLTYYFSSRLRN